jgi:hypothetical protein
MTGKERPPSLQTAAFCGVFDCYRIVLDLVPFGCRLAATGCLCWWNRWHRGTAQTVGGYIVATDRQRRE